MASVFGRTEPRLWTRPLRELTPENSAGFAVIAFAMQVLGVTLYPWQKWLLIHALELKSDGSYRFRMVIVLVARQNGKTTLASVLAAWWIFVDSKRHPDRVPPVKFKVVGTAQTLDIASGPWKQVKEWCNPNPDTPEESALAIPMLQAATAKVVDAHGEQAIVARSRAHYEMRAAKNARGKPAARVIMDELREHKNWAAWSALSQTTKAFWSRQLWGISNAGSPEAVVLKQQRERGMELIDEWDRYVEAGIQSAEDYANDPQHDTSIALFEWSAQKDCEKDDVDGILQANPSIGYGAITVADCISDAHSMPDADYRTEVLCQWVDAKVNSYIEINEFAKCYRPPASIVVPRGSRTVWGIDTSKNRDLSVVASATLTEAGRPFVQVRTQRPGMLWLPAYLKDLAEESGQWEVAVQSKGCPAMEFADQLENAGFTVHRIDGSHVGIATGRFKDRVSDGQLITVAQPNVRLAIAGGVTARYAENDAWNRYRSVTDVSPAIAETWALYGLEQCEPDPPDPIVMPAEAAVVRRDASGSPEVNILKTRF